MQVPGENSLTAAECKHKVHLPVVVQHAVQQQVQPEMPNALAHTAAAPAFSQRWQRLHRMGLHL